MCITNNEYYVKALLTINQSEEFHATVNASLFLNLMSKVTSETVELIVDNSSLNANISSGRNTSYKIAFVVPKDAKSIELEYETSIWTGNKEVIKLQ